MLYYPAISWQKVNLPKINDRDLLERVQSNLNSTEELCLIVKASTLNPSCQLIQLIKVKYIHDLFQDTKNLFNRLKKNKGTFIDPK